MKQLAFLDLDLTLFDYTSAREKATYAALKAMKVDFNEKEGVDVMTRLLVTYGDLLVDLGLPNFRRSWKAPELFALLLVLNDKKNFSNSINDFEKGLSKLVKKNKKNFGVNDDFLSRYKSRKSLLLLAKDSAIDKLKDRWNEILNDSKHRERLNSAVEAFDSYLDKDV